MSVSLTYYLEITSYVDKLKSDLSVTQRNLQWVFDQELFNFVGIKPYCPNMVAALKDVIVFEDLNAIGYKIKDKFERLDKAHALQGLRTLARMHASSIIFEEKKKAELNTSYSLSDDYQVLSNEAGYQETNSWFIQGHQGALEVIKVYSKYGQKDRLQKVEKNWINIWNTALQISRCSKEHRNVICHRDLWNNNILFHYKDNSENSEPDECVFVDFQAVYYQPPACDVMLFLHCNLSRKLREENMDTFLDFYHKELEAILQQHDINIADIIPKESFRASAEQQRQWGLIAFACLMPVIFIDDETTTRIFTDTKQFDQILNKDKGSFIKTRMKENLDYKNLLLETFEEIIERYCL